MQSDEDPTLEYDLWRWCNGRQVSKDQPPEHGYVHIGMFVAWLVNNAMLDEKWIAGSDLAVAVAAIRDRTGLPSALREGTDGRLGARCSQSRGRLSRAPTSRRIRLPARLGGAPSAEMPIVTPFRTTGPHTTGSRPLIRQAGIASGSTPAAPT